MTALFESPEETKRRKAREACARYRAKNLDARRNQTRAYMARKRREDPAWVKANNDRYLAKYPERWKAQKHSYYEKNKEKWTPFLESYKARYPDRVAAAIKAWAKKNPEKRKEYDRKAHARPEAKVRNCARQNRRDAQKRQAVPSWANHGVIEEVYALAAFMTGATGERWEVDHIVPLISTRVCGLHCEANLRVVPAAENRSKGNRFWPQML